VDPVDPVTPVYPVYAVGPSGPVAPVAPVAPVSPVPLTPPPPPPSVMPLLMSASPKFEFKMEGIKTVPQDEDILSDAVRLAKWKKRKDD
jgi:hypothetical protein